MNYFIDTKMRAFGEMMLDFFILMMCLVSACLTIVLVTSLFPEAKEMITQLFHYWDRST